MIKYAISIESKRMLLNRPSFSTSFLYYCNNSRDYVPMQKPNGQERDLRNAHYGGPVKVIFLVIDVRLRSICVIHIPEEQAYILQNFDM